MKNDNKFENISSFDFKKKFGQNFLTDKNLLSALVKDANVNQDEYVLEIGVGAGALTEVLVNVAKKVVGFEIDKQLCEFLQEKFSNKNNIELVFLDALKTKTEIIDDMFDGNYRIVANIPYYITSPLIFKFLEGSKKCVSQALMVQKEVAQRICALPNTENYGAMSVVCQHFNKCKILRVISKKMFRPMPKVDSAFIMLEKTKPFDFDYSYLVRSSFAMRRKTLINNLLKAYSFEKQSLIEIFNFLNWDLNIRAESLSESEYLLLLGQIKTKMSK